MEDLIKQYGYAILFIGTFAEGETILVLAGFLAHRGYLDISWVILTAFCGTLAGDQLFYYLGYLKGRPLLSRHPHWHARYARVQALLSHYQTPIVLGFRFLYGLRTITPFVIGLSKIAPLRFLLLNAFGALLWSLIVGLLGYALGKTLEAYLERIKEYEVLIMCAIAAVGLVLWLVHWKHRRNMKAP